MTGLLDLWPYLVVAVVSLCVGIVVGAVVAALGREELDPGGWPW